MANDAVQLKSIWFYIGPVRIMAGIIAVLVAIGYFFLESGDPFLEILVDLYCPGFAIFLIWAIPFDILVSRGLTTKFIDPTERRFARRSIVWFDMIAWLLLVLTWGGFFYMLAVQRINL